MYVCTTPACTELFFSAHPLPHLHLYTFLPLWVQKKKCIHILQLSIQFYNCFNILVYRKLFFSVIICVREFFFFCKYNMCTFGKLRGLIIHQIRDIFRKLCVVSRIFDGLLFDLLLFI